MWKPTGRINLDLIGPLVVNKMTQQEYDILNKNVEETFPSIQLDSLIDHRDRTLLYGYDCDKDTHHLYLKDKIFYYVVYGFPDVRLYLAVYDEQEIVNPVSIIPNKRLYPEACDYDFCQELKRLSIYLPFTTFNPDRPVEQYYGLLDEQLTHPMEGM